MATKTTELDQCNKDWLREWAVANVEILTLTDAPSNRVDEYGPIDPVVIDLQELLTSGREETKEDRLATALQVLASDRPTQQQFQDSVKLLVAEVHDLRTRVKRLEQGTRPRIIPLGAK